jgi:hypothetical protein
VANYKVSTVTWIYAKITKEQDTKHDNLYNGNKLITVPIIIIIIIIITTTIIIIIL